MTKSKFTLDVYRAQLDKSLGVPQANEPTSILQRLRQATSQFKIRQPKIK